MEEQRSGKKFDKKKWREKKYNKQLRVNQREEKYKKILKSKLQKQLKNDEAYGKLQFVNQDRPTLPSGKMNGPGRPSKIKMAQLERVNKLRDKQNVKEERRKRAEERQNALERYHKKKMENFQKLSKKTKKGQPLMKGRLQLLFEQVKKSVGSSS